MEAFGYYGRNLAGDEQKLYRALELAIPLMEKEINIPAMEISRITSIFEMYKLDHPEIFFASYPGYRMTGDGYYTCIPEYPFGKKQTAEMAGSLDRRIERILSPAALFDSYASVRFAREWILKNVTYEKLKRNYSHEIYGVLSHGIGVCEGIAKTFKVFLDRLGVESVIVIGDANPDGLRHAWNIVYLAGKPRHYDLTFDLSLINSGKKPKYFAMTDEQIFIDHTSPVYPVPECR